MPSRTVPSDRVVTYLGAYDVHAARVFGTVAEKTGIVPFLGLVERVMTTERYASSTEVYWVVDNGSSHNGQRSIDRMMAAWLGGPRRLDRLRERAAS